MLYLAGVHTRPFWMATAHGLELSLKAALLDAGASEERLMMEVNHSLRSALRVQPDVDLNAAITEVVEALHQPHRDHTFRYPDLRSAVGVDLMAGFARQSGRYQPP